MRIQRLSVEMRSVGGCTSVTEVNQRRWNRGVAAPVGQEESRERKAVCERLNSTATDCIQRASPAGEEASSSRKHTAAGLPLNGSAVKASTCDETARRRRRQRHFPFEPVRERQRETKEH